MRDVAYENTDVPFNGSFKLALVVQGSPLSLKRYEPDEITLKLQQHIEAPAEPIVKVGEVDKKGSIISCGRLKVSQFLVLGGIRLRGMEGSARL